MKGYKIPEGMVIIQDTREQKSPLLSRLPSGLCILSGVLPIGDYSIKGFENKFAIERKQLSDFCSYVGRERKKTVAKMERLRDLEWAGLCIEVNEDDLIKPQEFSQVEPETIRQALVSFDVRYGVHIFYSSNRDAVARWIMDRCIKYWEIKHEV